MVLHRATSVEAQLGKQTVVMRTINIGARETGPGRPACIIAEVGQAHDGSLGLAHSFVDAAADVGADCVKFQTHIAAAESTMDETFRVTFSHQDSSRYNYWRRMEFTSDQWSGLSEHARSRGLIFLSSPFSVAAVDMLTRLGVPAWKVGSGELGSADVLNAMLETRRPILLSTGMSGMSEIDGTIQWFRSASIEFAVLQCTSRYPTPLSEVGLNVIELLRKRYDCPVGLSDHSGKVDPSLAALARGANLIEVHLTLDRRMFGPDVSASLTVDELASIVSFRDALAVMDAYPVDKDEMALQLADMRRMFNKSLAPIHDLARGTTIEEHMLTRKKPGTGIPAEKITGVIGRRLARDVSATNLLRWDDLEGDNHT